MVKFLFGLKLWMVIRGFGNGLWELYSINYEVYLRVVDIINVLFVWDRLFEFLLLDYFFMIFWDWVDGNMVGWWWDI